MTKEHESTLWRHIPALLGLICAALLTISLVTCSKTADQTLDSWIPSNDYGQRAFETYTLVSDDQPSAPKLKVTPPEWVIGVATDGAREEDPSTSYTHLTYTFKTGNVVLSYATDDVDDFLAWQLSEDTIITSHLFGGRYTNITVSEIEEASWGGHDVVYGSYSFDDEYGRKNLCYVSACPVADGQVLTIVATESLGENNETAFLEAETLETLWSGITW